MSPQTITTLELHATGFDTLVDLLQTRSLQHPERIAYTFLQDGEGREIPLTYATLDRQARAIAAHLQTRARHGDRILLVYPQGLEYIAAFFGCLYAGMIAVPVFPPTMSRNVQRLEAVMADSEAAVALTTSHLLLKMEAQFAAQEEFARFDWLPSDLICETEADGWVEPVLTGDHPAFFQYTSGSTGRPKGVIVTHANLLHNEKVIAAALGNTEASVNVSWLPLYHDLGLIGCVLQTVYVGGTCVLLSPVDFLQRPFRWLQAVSKYKATFSGGPNFAYDLCVKKITAQQKATLDLSHWAHAFSGAEPVRSGTLQRFAEAFASCGFAKEAFYPCYGLAEATLMVTGNDAADGPVVLAVDAAALEEGRVEPVQTDTANSRELVGCGRVREELTVRIVDPASHAICADGQVGEIWVAGPSVAKGYWNQPELTEEMFAAQVYGADGQEDGAFLRTGDLGFVHGGQLFITGRLKDLILIRGRNYYPQDLELTAEQCHEAVTTAAAFSTETGGEERVVILVELDRRYRPRPGLEERQAPLYKEVIGAIRRSVAEEHQLQASAILLVKANSLPKTTSGKIQRHACRHDYLHNTLEIWGE